MIQVKLIITPITLRISPILFNILLKTTLGKNIPNILNGKNKIVPIIQPIPNRKSSFNFCSLSVDITLYGYLKSFLITLIFLFNYTTIYELFIYLLRPVLYKIILILFFSISLLLFYIHQLPLTQNLNYLIL